MTKIKKKKEKQPPVEKQFNLDIVPSILSLGFLHQYKLLVNPKWGENN